MPKIPPYLLSLAGEYRVCSELNKRGVFATITYGNRKSFDLYAISGRHARALKIEVKTSQTPKFVTGIGQKRKGLANSPDVPDFWVLVQLRRGPDGCYTERFFVLTHREICKKQTARNREYEKRYVERNRRKPDLSKGVDNIVVADVGKYEDQWSKILDDKRLKGKNS
jgi:hypothetical protein